MLISIFDAMLTGITLLGRGNSFIDDRGALGGIREHMPNILRDTLEGLFKSLRLILGLDAYSCDILDLANEDDLDPVWMRSITAYACQSYNHCKSACHHGHHSHLAIRFRVRLCGVTDQDQFPLRQPRMDLLHSVDLVVLCAQREIG